MQSSCSESQAAYPGRRQTCRGWRAKAGEILAWLLTRVTSMGLENGPKESAFEQAETIRAWDKLYRDAVTQYRGGTGNVQLLISGEPGEVADKLVLIANGKNSSAEVYRIMMMLMDIWDKEDDDLPRLGL